MATINIPESLNNNSPNSGAGIGARDTTLYQNDLAMNSELASIQANKADQSALASLESELASIQANKADQSALASLEETVDQRTKIQTGTGHAPSGTLVKMSYYESTTNGGGFASASHSLGSNIIAIIGQAQRNDNVWFSALSYYSTTNLVLETSISGLQNRPARFLVWHK